MYVFCTCRKWVMSVTPTLQNIFHCMKFSGQDSGWAHIMLKMATIVAAVTKANHVVLQISKSCRRTNKYYRTVSRPSQDFALFSGADTF